MKGDFSTERFQPSKHYNRVLKQQGRVDLDSDWNEQAAISQHLLRALIKDLLGRHGGPVDNCGFGLADAAAEGLKPQVGDCVLSKGRYYVDGLLVENDLPVYYSAQPELPVPPKLASGKTYLAYLDVWERHITYIEDDGIREVALGGPDTCTRVKTTWQLKMLETGGAAAEPEPVDTAALEKQLKETLEKIDAAKAELEAERDRAKQAVIKRTITRLEKQAATLKQRLAAGGPAGPAPAEPMVVECHELLKPLLDWKSGKLAARVEPSEPSDTPCVLPPESRYRGLENHLYRIEIHASGDTADASNMPTFKWSRENGSVATRWLGTTGNDVRVADSRGFAAGQWIEFTSETDDLAGQAGPLALIARIDGDVLTVTVAPKLKKDAVNPKVRRWDQTANENLTLVAGAIEIVPAPADGGWINIEDGIEVRFEPGQYRSGDYWLIPARVATGSIEWPQDASGGAAALPPRGIVHHYAPLFAVTATGANPFVTLVKDCRCLFAPLPCLDAVKP
jgi:hypothetical protein